jgi:medium-chain acyl-[acyl-carrier-protein] hydrolase
LEIYQKELKLTADYAAMNGYLRPSAMFALLQDAAFEDITRRGAGAGFTEPRGLIWMVVHMRAEVVCLPRYLDDVSVVTWPGSGKHGMYIRYYEILDKRRNPVISASGTWVLADAVKRRLAGDVDIGIQGVVTGREAEPPSRLRMPEVDKSAVLTARYSQADVNGHMNNARYLDLAEDLMPAEYLMSHTLRSAQADYLAEILPGEKLTVRFGERDGAWWFQGDTEKQNFRVRLSYI